MNYDHLHFLASLRNGLGFTKTCNLMGYSPQELSEHLRKNPDKLQECATATIMSFKALLTASNMAISNKNFDKWKQNNEYMRHYVTSVVLWESFCKRSEVTTKKICEALSLYKDSDEAATAMGMTRLELNQFLMEKPAIASFLKENVFLTK